MSEMLHAPVHLPGSAFEHARPVTRSDKEMKALFLTTALSFSSLSPLW